MPRICDHGDEFRTPEGRCKECKKQRKKARYRTSLYGKHEYPKACEGCGSTENLVADHDHSCCPPTQGYVRTCGKCYRGILCRRCNLILTKNVTPELLEILAQYLRERSL